MSDLSARMAARIEPSAAPAADAFRQPEVEKLRVTIYVPVDLQRQLKIAAAEDGVSVSGILTRLASGWLAERAKERHP